MIADSVMLPRYRLVEYNPAAEPECSAKTASTSDICNPGEAKPSPKPTSDNLGTRTSTETS